MSFKVNPKVSKVSEEVSKVSEEVSKASEEVPYAPPEEFLKVNDIIFICCKHIIDANGETPYTPCYDDAKCYLFQGVDDSSYTENGYNGEVFFENEEEPCGICIDGVVFGYYNDDDEMEREFNE